MRSSLFWDFTRFARIDRSYRCRGNFGREYFVEFEWDSVEGFKTFRVVGFNRSQVGGVLWQSLVTVQVKPRVDAYLKPSKLRRVKGGAMVFVTRFIPLTYPDSWGSDGSVIHQRTDIGLRPVGL